MARRKKNRFELPKFDFPAPKRTSRERSGVNWPSVKLPRLNLPNIHLPIRQFVVLIGIVIVVLVMMNLNGRLSEFYRLSQERDRLGTVVGNLDSTRTILQTQDAAAKSDQAAEDYARKSHMIKTGDHLVVALTPAGILTPTPTSDGSVTTTPQNWEVWWALFFGKAP
jgi:hypothetical protein